MNDETREALTQIYRSAIAAVDPYMSVKDSMTLEPGWLMIAGAGYPLTEINNIYVVGAGKAAYGMARAVEDILGGLISDGAIVTKDGHGGSLSRIKVYEAAHPVPDGRGVIAASRILQLARKADSGDLIICLLSGGASALMPMPAPGISLEDKRAATQLLLHSGADIAEINVVRKHLSAIKGGRLAEAAFPATVVTLIISDVIGDDIGTIASGPTAPDDSTFIQATEILKMRGVFDRLPKSVIQHLDRGCLGEVAETPNSDSEIFFTVTNQPVAFSLTALWKAHEVATYMGYTARVVEDPLQGEARDAAVKIAVDVVEQLAGDADKPLCLIYGGETTVTVTGPGKGGRNQEVALAFAAGIQGEAGISALFAGTDGQDGPTDAAGAFADGGTVSAGLRLGLVAVDYLSRNDSYNYFKQTGELFITGPTGTNVMDIGIVLIG